jgi:DNA-binding transcriptional LysR family regulator
VSTIKSLRDALARLGNVPSVEELLLVYDAGERLNDNTSLTAIAEELGINKHQLLRTIEKLRRATKAPEIFEKTRGAGTRRREEDEDLLRRVAKVLEAYQDLLSAYEDRSVVIRIGLPHLLSVRLLPEMLMRFRKLLESEGNTARVDFDLEHDEAATLLDEAPRGGMDLVLTTFEGADPADLLARATLPRSLICPTGSRVKRAFDRALERLPKKEHSPAQLPWEVLKDETCILVAKNTPEEVRDYLLRNTRRAVRVKTFEEAHRHVANGVGVCLTYPQLLSESDQKYIDTIDISDFVPPAQVCLLRPKKAKEARGELANRLIALLAGVMQEYLEGLGRRFERTRQLSGQFKRFGNVWHRVGSRGEWQWVKGEVELWATPLYVRGVERSDFHRDYQLYGRLCGEPASYNLFLRGESPDRGDQFVSQFYFRADELEAGRLVGFYVGRGLDGQPGVGQTVLLAERVESHQYLNELVMLRQG